jgi:hypothetical protein
MPLKPNMTTTPSATLGTVDQSQPFGQTGRVPRRSGADPSRSPGVPADFEMPIQAGKKFTFTVVASRSFHGSLPAWKA